MTITAAQYTAMRAVLRGALSGNYPGASNPSESEVLGFMSQLFSEGAGTVGLGPAQLTAISGALRSLLSGNFQLVGNPSDSQVVDFFNQVIADATGASSLTSVRYVALLAVLKDSLSSNCPGAANPSIADVRGYFGNAFFSPASLPGLAMWMSGRQSAFTDTAGAVPAAPFTVAGRVRRINQAASLGGNLQASSASQSGWLESNAVNFQTGLDELLNASPGMPAVTVSAATWFASFTVRETANAQYVLMGNDSGGQLNGFITFAGSLSLYCGGVGVATGIVCPYGSSVQVVYRCGATGYQLSVVVNGVRTNMAASSPYPSGAALTQTVSGTSTWLGTAPAALGSGLHGAIAEAGAVARAISDSENESLLVYLQSNTPAAPAPLQIPLLTVEGDSIAAGLGLSSRKAMWSFTMLPGLNATQPVNVINVAISGSTIADMVSRYAAVKPFRNASRSRNVLIAAGATNSMATQGLSGPTTLAAYYAYCDQALADGFRVVVCTVLPRNAGASFNTARAYFNSHLMAEYAARGYHAVANVAGISGMGADGDDANLTYYLDNIHPTDAGDALMSPVYQAAIQAAIN